ncbi:MAG: hypothetical protein JW769_04830 [Parachlamydiales bacterium]|nr:hypothetical protein [Parachlamydiales bacterium]
MRILVSFLALMLCVSNVYAKKSGYDLEDFFYTGPLITPSASNLIPKEICLQPYLFVFDYYGEYNHAWKKHSTTKSFSVNPLIFVQTGITQWLDVTGVFNGYYNKKDKEDTFKYGDTSITFGIQLSRETTHIPDMRITLSESFPTGKYQKLAPQKEGIDGVGSGSYVTTCAFNLSKILEWFQQHPINTRMSLAYSFPSNVHVQGFNTYGGGYNTNGTVKPGKLLSADFAFEYSFTGRFVYAMDFVFTYNSSIRFSGNVGTNNDGSLATMTSPEAYRFSIAPALEYNFNRNFGIIGGVWTSLAGKNSTDFISGVISLVATY